MSGQAPDQQVPRLAEVMYSRGISSADLSRRTGVSYGLITRYRTGRVLPRDYFGRPSKNALTIAGALGVDVDELFPPRESPFEAAA